MIKLFSLFAPKKKTVAVPFMETDYHSHILYGVDDGVQTLEEALYIVGEMQQAGVKHIHLTPHCYHPMFPNTKQKMQPLFEAFEQEVAKQYPTMQLTLGGECRISSHLYNAIEEGEELPLFDNNTILVENALIDSSEYLDDIFFMLRGKGYQVVMAHPERYPYWNSDIKNYLELAEKGWKFQVNTASFTGRYGRTVQSMALQMQQHNLISYYGSDLHKSSHLDAVNPT